MRRLAEVALFTDNVAEMTAFYTRLLDGRPSYQADDIAVFTLPGEITLLIHKKYPPADGQPPNQDHIAFGVEDVHAASAELDAHGIALLLKPEQYDWGTSAYLRDPDGRIVEVSETGS